MKKKIVSFTISMAMCLSLFSTMPTVMANNYELGDVTRDGIINIYDLITFSDILSGNIECDEEQAVIADVNEDGKCNLRDLVAISKTLITDPISSMEGENPNGTGITASSSEVKYGTTQTEITLSFTDDISFCQAYALEISYDADAPIEIGDISGYFSVYQNIENGIRIVGATSGTGSFKTTDFIKITFYIDSSAIAGTYPIYVDVIALDNNGTEVASPVGYSGSVTILPELKNGALKYDYADSNADGVNDYIIITDCEKSATEVEIPSIIDGLPVNKIDDYAFYDCNNLKKIIIPDSVTYIGNSAFKWCTALSEITLSNNIVSIGNSAFELCYSLTTDITLPESIVSIGERAFCDCSVKSLSILNKDCVIYDSEYTIPDYTIIYGYENSTAQIYAESYEKEFFLIDEKPKTYGNLTYKIADKDNDKIYECIEIVSCDTSATDVTIPEVLDGLPVTSIGKNAFNECRELAEITIPESIMYIGEQAFCNCKGLKKIAIENPNCEIYDSDSTINNSYYPDSTGTTVFNYNITIVGYKNSTAQAYAEKYDITFNEKTYQDPESGFKYNKYSNYIEITGHIDKTISVISIPEEIEGLPVTVIKDNAFYGYENLEEVIINNVEKIDKLAFSHCANLKKVSVNATIIEKSAFCYCQNLNSITIGDNVKEIKMMAFTNADDVTSVFIPDNTVIDPGAFSNCYSLKEFIVSDTNTNYSTIDGVLYDKSKTKLIAFPMAKSTTSYSIPDGTKTIGERAFWWNVYIDEIIVPDSVTVIEDSAFSHCYYMNKITLPEKISDMGGGVFAYCESLTEIVIPEGVTELTASEEYLWGSDSPKTYEFLNNCDKLTSITFPESLVSINDFRRNLPETDIRGVYIIKNPDCVIFDSPNILATQLIWDADNNKSYYTLNGTIYGYENSTAQIYAEKYGYDFATIGSEPIITAPVTTTPVTTTNSAATHSTTCTSVTTQKTDLSAQTTILTEEPLITTTVLTEAPLITTTTILTEKPLITTTTELTEAPAVTTTTASTTQTIVTTDITDIEDIETGDANLDGKLNVRDAAFIASALAKGLANTLPENADYNGDGKVNVRDAAAIASYLAKRL